MSDIRVSACSTPGSRHVRHPGLGTFDTRVSDTRKRLTGKMTQEGNNTETCNEKKYRKKNGRGKDTKKQRHSKRTDTEKRRKAADSLENTKQATTQQTC
ncbi:hypothetical protein DWY65_16030 [Bacteroides stercoris]|uniref:Uncharacterized protein n=1 Tax=Bacteroides stercoris TaxID=46506 RepID=A0A412DBK9_BACSE|nr:hypothetical protein DWY65_16030 [Bacteroides stercoris]